MLNEAPPMVRLAQKSSPGKRAAGKGFTLIEVLVALFVLALGLLGMAMLQTAGLRFNTNSYSRTQATYFAYDIIDRMRANPAGFKDGLYDVDDNAAAVAAISAYGSCESSSCNCDSGACDSINLAKYDLGRWYQHQDRLLPGVLAAADAGKRATILRDGNRATITIYWQEEDHAGANVKEQVWHVELPQWP